MKRCYFILLPLTLLLPAQKTSTSSEDFTIRTVSRLVLLDVTVKDPSGGFVAGLAKDDFQVFEDGKKQEISQFASDDIPVTVGILVDESGSMRSKRAEVITAALGFVTSSNPQDEMFVLNFNERVRRGLPDTVLFTDDIAKLRAALISGKAEGRTALFDAIAAGLKQLDMGRRDKKTLVVISDGGDNVSTTKAKEVMDMVVQSAATIYTIGVFDNDDPDRNPDFLKKLAQITGGESFFPTKIEDIVPVCRRIAKEIRTRYTVGYIPSVDSGRKVRHLKVQVASAGRGRLSVRTRTMYMLRDEAVAGK